ncbi:MAG: TIGR01777 family oxidoreductase, partial [Elusimicrobiales bacterium]|nr:TIGR01777 family oxidoreductase [Elusimicrobiales bacterium]
GRTEAPEGIDHPAFHYIAADTTQSGDWQDALADQEVVVNLAGKSIFTRWSEKAKNQIHDSRILTTRNLVAALPANRGTTLCSTSAVGFYGDRGDAILTEDEPPGDDFLAKVGQAWEKEARVAEAKGVRVVLTRFGIVLDRDGGALAAMIPAFRFFLGGSLGSGRQWFPWIHMQDLVAALRFVIDNAQLSGAYNFCAPEPVRHEALAADLGRKLNRPACMPAPAFMIKLVLGEFGQTLLCSQRAVPEKLLDAGFTFTYPDIDAALGEIVNRRAA